MENQNLGTNYTNNSSQEQYNNSNLAFEPGTANARQYYGTDNAFGAYYAAPNTAKVNKAKTADVEAFRKYGLIAIIYAVWHTFCLYDNNSGITYPFYMLGTLILIAWARKRDGLSILKDRNGKAGLNIFYIISLMLLSISKCTTANFDLIWIDEFAITLLVFSFLVHMYVDTREWDIIGWIFGIALTALKPFSHFGDPMEDMAAWVKSRGSKMNGEKKANIMAVIAGLGIGLPMLFVVVALLASADAVFSNTITSTFEFIFEFDYIWDLIAITWMILWSIWLFYTVIKGLNKKGIEVDVTKRSGFNPIVGITFTSLLCVVYLFFSVIQIFGLFMGKMTLPDNYTYAEYAHEGFYQLLAVSLMNLALVTLCQRLFKRSLVLKALLMVVGMCTYIMIASSAFRMIMYIGAYRLTFLRVFVLWFLVVISLWLAYLLASLIDETFPVFNLCMITVTVMYIAFVFANPDYHIAKYDLQYLGDTTMDGRVDRYSSQSMQSYLTMDISMDAVPAMAGNKELLKLYGENLAESRTEKYKLNLNTLRKFNFSEYRAYKLINEVYGE
ncbi:DUF4153 domain-containing protein [Butyrivibrio sp. AC2005]|uniref:DUF4153 domain-containing protein n=1 Tax=Butyrivibrio sp. AC2005 TaxID=1280672 RepID=UPI000401065C|nr:DUF4173 domain-containing protein [Butyrivibrio sp. AC2005]